MYNVHMFNLFSKNIGLGIEISTKYIRFVEVQERNRIRSVLRFGRVKIPTSVFEDKKYEELAEILQPILKNSQAKNIRVVLPDESIRFFTLLIPKVSQKEILEHIVLGLKENVSYHEGKDALLDYNILTEENGVWTVRTATISKESQEMFKPVLGLLQKYNFHIERANQAALVGAGGDTEMPSIHVQFGDDFCSVSGVFGSSVQMYQEIPFSTYRFLTEIQKRLTQPSHTASTYLSTIGVYGADTVSFVSETLKPFEVVLDHAIASFGKKTNTKIEKITLGGMFAGYKGVDQMIGKMVRVPTFAAYPWHPLQTNFDDTIYEIKKHETLEYLVALGLSLESLD